MSKQAPPSPPRNVNRLAKEASPYLLQHAHNPVDWWPWCDEALAEAKRRDVPILLSIGYSACHWCHVMERESFEDAAIARLMNELFVNIKVDREERPDLDQIYQLVVQLFGRSGGWPLTVFLTPDQRPFFGGTYFPPEGRYGIAGLPEILRAVSTAYHERRDEVVGQAAELTKAIAEVGKGEAGGPYVPGPDLLERVSSQLLRRFDAEHGGFGRAPKFPNTMPLEVLLRRGVLEGDPAALGAVRRQLDAMRAGGIWDQLGGGFHRYSTDERWLVPHFEKMLYDNALLLRSYVDAHRAFASAAFADTASELAAYVEREMTDAAGGYYASQDADSEGEEGKFFVWDEAEVREAVAAAREGAAAPPDGEAADDLAVAAALASFGVTPAGNFEEHGRPTFHTVLHVARPVAAVAPLLGVSAEDASAALARAMRAMFAARERRPRPFRDEKILTSWNALMIGAMAEAGAALAEPRLVSSAERAFAFVSDVLVQRDGRTRAGRLAKQVDGRWIVREQGFLDDHAYLANAALDLYEVTGDPSKALLARALADTILDVFWSPGDGFFFTPADGERLITRSQDPYDNAVPSGASIAARALLRLGTLAEPRYAEIAAQELARSAGAAVANPLGYGQTLCELDRLVRGSVDVVLVGAREDERTQALARAVFARWLPNRTVAWLDPTDAASREACAHLAEGKPVKAAPAAYVCRGRTCSLPVATGEELGRLL